MSSGILTSSISLTLLQEPKCAADSNKYLEEGTSEIAMKLFSPSGPPDFSFFISVPDIFSFYDNPSILSARIPVGH